MVQAPEKNLSLEEFLKLPEAKPASEYIDGQIIQKPMPQGKHSRLQGKLVTCTFGGRSPMPDIAVFAWERIPLDLQGRIANVFQTAPDWTIEILLPDQSQNRVTRNILHCLAHGCQLGWLVDPEDQF